MQVVSSASSFVLRDGRVLLLHRPARMRSFPDRWSAVSGKLEVGEIALQAALREICEETGYDPDSLRILAAGEPFEAVEEAREICWRIHPFLCLLDDAADPQLDEESDDYRWVRFHEVENYPTVPRLAEVFTELQPRLPEGLTQEAKALREDREHGATELGQRMLEILDHALPTLLDWRQWVWTVMLLGASRPAMAPLAELARRLLVDAGPRERPEHTPPWAAILSGRDRVTVAERIVEMKDALTRATNDAAEAGARRLLGHSRVTTYSYSSTVREAFRLLADHPERPREVLLSPAQPTDEGLVMADALRRFGYDVELVRDDELTVRLSESSLLLLGADAVFPDGAIANRAGSSILARAAQALGLGVEVVADGFKWQPNPDAFESERVGVEASAKPLFERVEAEWIDRIVGFQNRSG